MTIARHFSAGNSTYEHQAVPEGRLKYPYFSRPSGTLKTTASCPGTEVPGYYHRVPPGRRLA